MADISVKESTPKWKFPFKIKIENRIDNPPRWLSPVLSLAAVAIALLIGAVVIWIAGGDPWAAYSHIAKYSLGSWGVLSDTMVKAIPLMLVGLACSIAFRMKLWNIGAEGQFFLGAFGASMVVLLPVLPMEAPKWQFILVSAGFGMFFGALWGFVPGFLKARYNVNEIISTLMMNYIAIYFVEWLIHGPWKGPTARGFAYTDTFPRAAWLPTLYGTRIHWPTLILGLILAVVMYIMVTRTRSGFEIRVIGENPDAARFAGISQFKTTLIVMLISGGLAGLAGVGEVAGIHMRLLGPTNISMGYGYTAIIVAWLARRNPLAVIVTSLLFAVIMTGGDVIKVSLGLPFQLINVFNGLILFFLIGSEILLRYKISFLLRR